MTVNPYDQLYTPPMATIRPTVGNYTHDAWQLYAHTSGNYTPVRLATTRLYVRHTSDSKTQQTIRTGGLRHLYTRHQESISTHLTSSGKERTSNTALLQDANLFMLSCSIVIDRLVPTATEPHQSEADPHNTTTTAGITKRIHPST